MVHVHVVVRGSHVYKELGKRARYYTFIMQSNDGALQHGFTGFDLQLLENEISLFLSSVSVHQQVKSLIKENGYPRQAAEEVIARFYARRDFNKNPEGSPYVFVTRYIIGNKHSFVFKNSYIQTWSSEAEKKVLLTSN